MKKHLSRTLVTLLASLSISACDSTKNETAGTEPAAAPHFGLGSTTEILVTSEEGDRIAPRGNVTFREGQASGTVITIHPGEVRQTLSGIGSSFTESSAFVLAHLDPDQRHEVMQRIYGENGANFSMARTTIGSTDFSVTGKFSYATVEGDSDLRHFSIEVDRDGFSRAEYPGIRDEAYDLLPMIHEALAIKRSQEDPSLGIVASAWTAPPWMKDIEDWYIGGTPETFGEGTGGRLKEEYVGVYADYLLKYLDAYRSEGVEIWGLTPVNEPHGNSGQWESMHFTPETQRDFIKSELGPKLRSSAHNDVRLLIYDQNRDDMEHWADVILGDPEAAQYVYGTAVHWYASTYKVFEEAITAVRERFPGFEVIHTEGTIDNLGLAAPGGIGDPEGFQESGWFDNDAFWWNQNATDWAYTASWAPNAEDHPVYTPVHRYARNIIVSLNHGMAGWIDWNVVLDRHGGPNHVGNLCGAPIMIDTDTGQVYYTPVYYVLAQLSRTIRPGDRAVQTQRQLGGLNTTRKPISYGLQIGAQFAEVEIPANSVQTVRVALN
jgi:glucosylceramidase